MSRNRMSARGALLRPLIATIRLPGGRKSGQGKKRGRERKGWYCRPAQGAKESREMKGKRRDRKQRRGEGEQVRKKSESCLAVHFGLGALNRVEDTLAIALSTP